MADSKGANPLPSSSSSSADDKLSAEEKKHDASRRFAGWAALCFFSIIALAAQVSDTWDSPREKDDTFVIVVGATSLGLSFLSIMGYALFRDGFAGGAVEGLFAVLCQVFWICGMPVIMDADRDIAVSKGLAVGAPTFIRNANIYFFSWASTIAIVYVLGRFARQVILERQANTRSLVKFAPKTNLWYLLTLASLVVLVDATELYKAFECPGDDPDLCTGTKYAIGLGVVGTFLSFGCSLLATIGKMVRWLEFFAAVLIFGLYMAGVGLITFNDGPGTSLGNLYFASWMGSGVTAVLLVRSYRDILQYFRRKNKPSDQKLPDDIETSKQDEEPVVFPDVEMGGDEKEGKDARNKDEDEGEGQNEDEDDEPDWVKGEPEATPNKTVTKVEKEEEIEVEVGPEKEAPDNNADDKEEEEEIKPKTTTKAKKRTSSKSSSKKQSSLKAAAKSKKKDPEPNNEKEKTNPFEDNDEDGADSGAGSAEDHPPTEETTYDNTGATKTDDASSKEKERGDSPTTTKESD